RIGDWAIRPPADGPWPAVRTNQNNSGPLKYLARACRHNRAWWRWPIGWTHRSVEGTPMKTMQYAATLALALGLSISSQAQIRTGPERDILHAQFCVPPDNSADVHKLYCRGGPARDGPARTWLA